MGQNQTLQIDQGSTFRQTFLACSSLDPNVPIDLTGYTAKLQFRSAKNVTTALLTLTDVQSSYGQIILGSTSGTFEIYIVDATTATLSGSGFYDLKLFAPGGDSKRPIEGTYTVSPNVTR